MCILCKWFCVCLCNISEYTDSRICVKGQISGLLIFFNKTNFIAGGFKIIIDLTAHFNTWAITKQVIWKTKQQAFSAPALTSKLVLV